MENIIDINFNFQLLDSQITTCLYQYNIAKDNFCGGSETEDGVIDKGMAVIGHIDFCLSLLNYRLSLINYKYIENKEQNKNKLNNEKQNLLRKINWYKKLKFSIEKECNKINIGEFDFDDEPDCND